jgi:endonuclease/exonuclease/phosphatase family metal-dependent hydrolase
MFKVCALASLVAVAACGDQTDAATPKLPSADASVKDAAPEGWGDPTTTRRPGALRIAQLNVRRYFDDVCDSGNCTGDGFEEAVTTAAFAKRAAQIAEGIARLDADVITLAEVETQGCLDALRTKLKESGYDYPVAHLAETGAPGSLDVAVLARGKLDSIVTHRQEMPLTRPDGSKTTFTRELPEVHLTVGAHSVIVFAAHFRSKVTDDPGRRLAEAQATHDIMVAVGADNGGALVLLGGDLNDTPGSPPLDALEQDAALVRVAKDLSAGDQGTYTYAGQKTAIDHIFTTAARAPSYVPKSATVVSDDNAGFAGSDHASLYADFTIP